jgi:hypothetical protein
VHEGSIGFELPLCLQKTVVAIKSISRWEFNQVLPDHIFLESLVGTPVAWWADEARSIIGATAQGAMEPSWRYIILERNGHEHFRVCNLQSGIKSRLMASMQLLRAMETLRKSRKDKLASRTQEPPTTRASGTRLQLGHGSALRSRGLWQHPD